MNFDFGDVLTRAGRITWQNKGLWILGILAALGSRGGGGGNANFNMPNTFNPGGQPAPDFPNLRSIERLLEENLPAIIGVALTIVCVVILINILFLVLSWIGRAGLIGGARLAQANGRVTFGEAWGVGQSNIGRLFSIWLITDLPLAIVGLAIAVIAVALVITAISAGSNNFEELMAGMSLGLVCLIPIICVLALAGIILAILNHMGTLAAVSEEKSGLAAIGRGWEVLRANPLPLIILGVILIVLDVMFSFLIALPLILAVLPVVIGIAAGAMSDSEALMGGGALFAVLCCVAYLPVLLALRGLFETWSLTSWTLAYDRLTGAAPTPSAPSYPRSPPLLT